MSGERIDIFVDQETGKATIDCEGYDGEKCQKDLAVLGALMEALGVDMDVLSSEKKRPVAEREVTHAKTKVKA